MVMGVLYRIFPEISIVWFKNIQKYSIIPKNTGNTPAFSSVQRSLQTEQVSSFVSMSQDLPGAGRIAPAFTFANESVSTNNV